MSLGLELIEVVSKRNPGAMRVCFEIAEELPQESAAFAFAVLLAQNIVAHDLWYLYKYCDYSAAKVHACLVQDTATQKLQSVKGSSFYQERGE